MATLDDDCTTLHDKLNVTVVSEASKSKDQARYLVYRLLLWPLMPIIIVLAFIDVYDFAYDALPDAVRHPAIALTVKCHSACTPMLQV
jgi:hypothetical protein